MATTDIVCVVDDDSSVRSAIASLMRSCGHKVESFGSAQDFLDWSRTHYAACVVSDVQMPNMSGFEMFDRMLGVGMRSAVILITAFPTPALEATAKAKGALAFLSKPIDAQELSDHVQSALTNAPRAP